MVIAYSSVDWRYSQDDPGINTLTHMEEDGRRLFLLDRILTYKEKHNNR